ncbi:hypothetical protein D9758_007338 [Tetrapyrgos nigripes]|uniref:Uncharacterized protein n=1 Tax=Tetrapyrgos nigripes TaxID=182062 RepID=A0A8H5GBC7_9AGAR|nr:hypothetical protein D9758_007338 [Tetrapyrgos nigripes]
MVRFLVFKRKARFLWSRLTLNRRTTAFFLFGLIHCIVQGTIHSVMFALDSKYDTFLSRLEEKAQLPPSSHAFLEGPSSQPRITKCDWIPHNPSVCNTVYYPADGGTVPFNDSEISTRTRMVFDHIDQLTFQIASLPNLTTNSFSISVSAGANVLGVNFDNQCVNTLLYPRLQIQNRRQEDVTLVLLQLWLFSISIMAMVYHSVPHILASFVSRVLLTMWSLYAVSNEGYMSNVFRTVSRSSCSIDLFEEYAPKRLSYEIVISALNLSALVISSYLCYALFKLYSTQCMKCIGPPRQIAPFYKACLQLEVFILSAGMGLWVNQLFNTYYSTTHSMDYNGLDFASARRQFNLNDSTLQGWLLFQWPFLAALTVSSYVLIASSFALGVLCRCQFGKGLAQYLRAEETLASMDFSAEVFDNGNDRQPSHLDEKSRDDFDFYPQNEYIHTV